MGEANQISEDLNDAVKQPAIQALNIGGQRIVVIHH
jgi:hypothetical protein